MASVLVLYNPPTDPAAFDDYYRSTHIPLAKKMPGLRSFSVSKGPVNAAGGASPYYYVAELVFDSIQAIQAAFASPEGRETAADVPKFATGGATILLYETEEV